MKKGLIQIYTGDGKGKTTASVGQVMRALGHEKKVCFIQLFKPKQFYGEQKILPKLKNIDFFSFCNIHYFCNKRVKRNQIKQECRKAINFIKEIFNRNKYNVLVLDEFNIATRDRFINTDELVNLLKHKPVNLEIIITGRSASNKIIKFADLVTEMKKIKHPYDKNIKARESIEF